MVREGGPEKTRLLPGVGSLTHWPAPPGRLPSVTASERASAAPCAQLPGRPRFPTDAAKWPLGSPWRTRRIRLGNQRGKGLVPACRLLLLLLRRRRRLPPPPCQPLGEKRHPRREASEATLQRIIEYSGFFRISGDEQ